MSRAEKLAKALEQILLSRLAADQLRLPVLPEVAARCTGLESEEFTPQEAQSTLALDPLLAADLARQYGKPGFGLPGLLEQLDADGLREFFSDATRRQVKDSRSHAINDQCRGIWAHCVTVAVLSRDLMSASGGEGAEEAYLSGLLHDVGEPIAAGFLLEVEDLLAQRGAVWLPPEEWLSAVRLLRREVGLAVARGWPLPEPVQQCIERSGEYDDTNRETLANYVRLADALATKAGLGVADVEAGDAEARVVSGRSLLGVEEDLIESLTTNLADRVRELMTLEAVPA